MSNASRIAHEPGFDVNQLSPKQFAEYWSKIGVLFDEPDLFGEDGRLVEDNTIQVALLKSAYALHMNPFIDVPAQVQENGGRVQYGWRSNLHCTANKGVFNT